MKRKKNHVDDLFSFLFFSCFLWIHIISPSCNHLAFFYSSFLNQLLINFKPSGIHSYLGHGLFVFVLNAFFKLRGLWCAADGISPHPRLCTQPYHSVRPPESPPSVFVEWMNKNMLCWWGGVVCVQARFRQEAIACKSECFHPNPEPWLRALWCLLSPSSRESKQKIHY